MTASRDPLNITFAALADPTRRRILAMLSEGEKTVTQLAEPFQITQPAISKHLKVLERAGLIERGREAQWRPARLRAEPLKVASDWVEQYRQHWEESFDRLDGYLLSTYAGMEGVKRKEPGFGIGKTLRNVLRKMGKSLIRFWSNNTHR